MTERQLHVGPEFNFPADAITQSIALLAVRRAGKSNAAAVIAEEMYHAARAWVAIDPKGDWWGLRSSRDGKGDGLPVPIFGGLHGDMPLIPEAGHLIADLITDQNLTCVLDVSEFPSKAAQMRFLADLAERLFRLHGRNPVPRHLFLEEADDFIPQVVRAEQARCTGAWTKLVKQGGSRGLGVTLVSQRSAVVNKDALTQAETLIALRTTSPQDRKAILGWVDYHAVARELVDSLPGLDDGEAWVCSPHWLARHGQPAIQRKQFRQRATFDSGATPALRKRAPVASLADIDLGALRERMTAVTEKAEQDDPRALRRQIADLQRQVKATGDAPKLAAENRELRGQLEAALAREPERVEVPVLAPGDVAAAEQAIAALRDIAGGLEIALSRAVRQPAPAPQGTVTAPVRTPARTQVPSPANPADVPAAPAGQRPLKAGARSMLEQLARHHPLKMTRGQLAALSGIKGSGSTFSSYFSALRINGYVTQEGAFVVITPEGLTAAGAAAGTAPPTAEEIRAQWRSVLKAGARSMLDHLLKRYPDPITRADLADLAGINPAGSTLSSYLSTLRSNNLITETGDGIIAADVFFLAEVSADA